MSAFGIRAVVGVAIACAAPLAAAATPITGGRYEGRTVALTTSAEGTGLAPAHALGDGQLLQSAVRYPACGGITVAGRYFRGAIHAENVATGVDGRNRSVQYEIFYETGNELWNHFTAGPKKGRWDGPHALDGSRAAAITLTTAKSVDPFAIAP